MYSVEEGFRERLEEAHAAAGRWQQQVQSATAIAEESERRRQEAETASTTRVEQVEAERNDAEVKAGKAQERCEQLVSLLTVVQAEAASQRRELEAIVAAERDRLPSAVAHALALQEKRSEEALAVASDAGRAAELKLQGELAATKEEEAGKRTQLEAELNSLKRELAKGVVARR